jgi:branched-subunit amino acid aminotransferase/4-amino-4-deoxychorismate lyase
VDLPAWLDDGPVAASSATVRASDAGLRSGLGVFETLRAHGTALLAADRHLERLVHGAARLAIAVDTDRVAHALTATLAAPRDVHEVAARITLTAGPVAGDRWPATPIGPATLLITLHPAPPLPLPAVSAVTVTARRWPADVKSTSYLASVLAQREAAAAGADVAVLVDGDELLETAEGNLIALIDGELVTPPDDGRLLAGVTRGLVLEEGERLGLASREASLRHADVARADVLLVTSAVSGLRTVRTLDGSPVRGSDGASDTHPVAADLRAALERRRR